MGCRNKLHGPPGMVVEGPEETSVRLWFELLHRKLEVTGASGGAVYEMYE